MFYFLEGLLIRPLVNRIAALLFTSLWLYHKDRHVARVEHLVREAMDSRMRWETI